ncbi:hypothetical protein SO802_023395 [Lithocarpus litseifolius]|uniref:Uncharacterized protein n=1 Tax=Lithocarpus litseifolius TaxID=425828 RepID=A0AAW2C8P2_9ROSI
MGPVLSGARNDHLRRYCCLACSSEDDFGSEYDSSTSSLDCVLSSESYATGPKRVELEDQSEEEKKKKMVTKRSVSSSIKEISDSGDDSVFPTKISVKKRRKVVDEKAEGTATASSKRGRVRVQFCLNVVGFFPELYVMVLLRLL